MKYKSLYIVFASSLLILFVLVYQGTFAYFTATITDNRGEAGGTVLTSADLKDLVLVNGENTGDNLWIPGTFKEFEFSIKNPSSVDLCVKLVWKDVTNTWHNTSDLVYTLTDSEGNEIVHETPFPTSSDATLLASLKVPANEETPNKYTIKVTYKDTEKNQYEDMGAYFSATVEGQLTECASNPSGGGVVEPPSNPTPFPDSVFANIDKPDKETGNGLYTVDHSQDKDTTLGDEWKEKPEYRYAGPDPDNYVWFNSDAECTKEGDEDNKHCELWRIIGLVNVKVKDDAGERIEQRIKIIKDKSLKDTMEWDSGYTNDWTQASLMTYLNSGDYYINKLREQAKEMIAEDIIWNIGGYDVSVKTAEIYGYERGTTGGKAAPTITTWPAKDDETTIARVGLMYASDYGYAVGGESRSCINGTNLSGYSACKINNWLYLGSKEWTLSPVSSFYDYAFYLDSAGDFDYYYNVSNFYAVRPVVYLSSKASITDGKGTESEPYILSY